MSFYGLLFNIGATIGDYRRDKKIPIPQGVAQCRDIRYGSHGKWSLLDVYYPEHAEGSLPTIVSIHGGGYIYGTKEIYRRYGMDMAARGFAFVNFNYRLAPKWKFPTPLYDTNAVLEWVCKNAAQYHLDPERIILVGDSAGAQLASQYAAIRTNPDYAALFPMNLAPVNIRCLGLNCGIYDPAALRKGTSMEGLIRDYMGELAFADDPRFHVMDAIGPGYPPAFIATAHHDFLRDNARPMFDHLQSRDVPAEVRCYGSDEAKDVAHVFHVNIALPEAKCCNDDEAEFFKRYI